MNYNIMSYIKYEFTVNFCLVFDFIYFHIFQMGMFHKKVFINKSVELETNYFYFIRLLR